MTGMICTIYSGIPCLVLPDFEVVRKGQILHFVSGDRRFMVNSKNNSMDKAPATGWLLPSVAEGLPKAMS
jgi:hypothetical protein